LTILEDMAQKEGQHIAKNKLFQKSGIEVLRVPLPVGDYIVSNEKVLDVIERKAKRNVDLKKMDFLGTYSVSVDSKFDIQELIGDICGKSHERFRDECILAQNNGIKLYILVENKGGLISGTRDIYNKTVYSIEDLFSWKNPRLFIMKNSSEIIGHTKSGYPRYRKVQKYPTATKGATLAKACLTMQEKYGCEFLFCTPEESGERILQLLGVNVNG
jgi:ribosome-associated protein